MVTPPSRAVGEYGASIYWNETAPHAPRPVLAAGIVVAIVVVVRHRTNVARIASGTENRIRLGGSGKEGP